MENTKSLVKQDQLASVYTVLLGAVRDIGVPHSSTDPTLKTIYLKDLNLHQDS